jgi:cytochrome c oxidase assembly protein subunit 15
VCATVALLGLGAVVTTFRVGMADPIWPTYPWHLFLISWQEPSPGFLIEHTHRLAGYVVGLCAIVLAIGLWRYQPRGRLGVLGLVALLSVIIQGLLGGFRVRLNALIGADLALIHGCFAQLAFALIVSLALFTSRSWDISAPASEDNARMRRWSILTAALVYLQIVFGSLVRHTDSVVGQRGHLLAAFAVVAAVIWLVKLSGEGSGRDKTVGNAARLLAAFVALQVMIGVETWLAKYAPGTLPAMQPVTLRQGMVRTAHFLVGSGVFATAVVVMLRANAHRFSTVHIVADAAARPLGSMEGAA